MTWQTLRTVEGEYVPVNMDNVAFFAENRIYFCGGQILILDPTVDVQVMDGGWLQIRTWYVLPSDPELAQVMRREVAKLGLVLSNDKTWCTVEQRQSLELTMALRS